GLGSRSGCLESREELAESGLTVDAVVEVSPAREQVGVAEVQDEVVWTRVCGRITGHADSPSSQSERRVNAGRRFTPQLGCRIHVARAPPVKGDAVQRWEAVYLCTTRTGS